RFNSKAPQTNPRALNWSAFCTSTSRDFRMAARARNGPGLRIGESDRRGCATAITRSIHRRSASLRRRTSHSSSKTPTSFLIPEVLFEAGHPEVGRAAAREAATDSFFEAANEYCEHSTPNVQNEWSPGTKPRAGISWFSNCDGQRRRSIVDERHRLSDLLEHRVGREVFTSPAAASRDPNPMCTRCDIQHLQTFAGPNVHGTC